MAEETKDFILKDKEDATEPDKSDEAPPRKSTPHATMPVMTFATFIISLNHSALVNLGKIEDPSTGTKTKNLELAKQTIDIIAMLGEKTKGNLTEEEDGMLNGLLYDLRMSYVKATQ
jgi:hypothetical protein